VTPAYPDGVQLVIHGHRLPGLDCGRYSNIHVGLQVGKEPSGLVPADAARAEWVAELERVGDDYRGPAVQGRKGERFVYLTWGTVAGDTFTMFRRAKLMLADLPSAQEVHVDVHLTDDHGMPRCAWLRPPALQVRQPTS
jgi:hypothetical protein